MIINFFNPETGKDDHPVHIRNVTLGTVVQKTVFEPQLAGGGRVAVDNYGHVAGFARNSTGELILQVQWDAPQWDGNLCPRTVNIHPSNVIFL